MNKLIIIILMLSLSCKSTKTVEKHEIVVDAKVSEKTSIQKSEETKVYKNNDIVIVENIEEIVYSKPDSNSKQVIAKILRTNRHSYTKQKDSTLNQNKSEEVVTKEEDVKVKSREIITKKNTNVFVLVSIVSMCIASVIIILFFATSNEKKL